MKTKTLILLLLTIFISSCNNNSEQQQSIDNTVKQTEIVTKEQPEFRNTLQEGILMSITPTTIVEDNSDSRATNGAILGGVGSMLLSRRPSFTKTIIGAGIGGAVGKMTSNPGVSYTEYLLVIRNTKTNQIIQKSSKNGDFKVKDTINYDVYSNIVFKK